MLIDLIGVHALEKAELGPEWVIAGWENLDVTHDGIEAMRFEAMVCTARITRGKRKGQINWRKADRKTMRNIYVTIAEHIEWRPKWGERTGKCPECMGRGTQMVSWHHINGTVTKPCESCNGTGVYGVLGIETPARPKTPQGARLPTEGLEHK